MWALLRPILGNPSVNLQLGLATAFIHMLAIAPSLYVVLIYGRYMSHGLDATLISLSAGVLIALTMESLLRRSRYRLMAAICAKVEREKVEAVTAHALRAKIDALQQLSPELRQVPQRSLEQLAVAIAPSSLLALIDAPFVVIFLLALIMMAWQVGILATFIIMATVIFLALRARAMNHASRVLQQAASVQLEHSRAAERWDTVRLTTSADWLNQQWNKRIGDSRWLRFDAQRQSEGVQQGSQVFGALLSILTIALAAKLTTIQMLDAGVLFGANILAMRAFALISRPVQQFFVLLQGKQALDLIEQYLQIPTEPKDGTRPTYCSGRLEFKDVAVWHPGSSTPLIEGLNLVVGAGGLVTFIGQNGTGKTTCARLLANLIQPVRGAILADGIDLRQLDPTWWRRQLVYLPQEPEFLDATLRDNMLLLNPSATDEQITEVLRELGLGIFVDQHPEGLNLRINQGGRTLSVGTRRRLALARALLTDGRVVIIDEPTEGLDHYGVKLVNEVLNNAVKQGKTVIVTVQEAGDLAQHGQVVDLNNKPVPTIFPPRTNNHVAAEQRVATAQ